MGKHHRILVATDNLKDQINGVAVTFKHLAQQSKSAGYEMHFIDPSDFYHISFPKYKEVKLALPFRIGSKIKRIRPDYIHIATEGPIGLATRLYCDKHNICYNTSYHTKFPEYLEQLHGIPIDLTYKYMRWFHKHSGIVLTTTSSMKKLLLEKDFHNNIIEWTRGVDTSNFNGLTRRKISNKPIVLFVGRVSKEKNLEKLLVLQDEYDIIIVGDGPDKFNLEKKYTKVYFVGYKTGKDLFQYYLNADVFCFPSITDTFGIVLIEALSAGTPVAAYPVTGPIDIIKTGVNGYLSYDLRANINSCLALDRNVIKASSSEWTWENCWDIFRNNLCKINQNVGIT